MYDSFFVFGSYIAAWRTASFIGNRFADGWLEPALHHAGVAGGRMRAVIHRRPCPSNIELCTSLRLVQMFSLAQYGDGLRVGPDATGVLGSCGGTFSVEVFDVVGSSTGVLSVLISGELYTMPFALTVGLRRSVTARSWRYVLSVPQFHSVMTMFRSTPAGRGGAGGTSPAAMRSVQSANIAVVRCMPTKLNIFTMSAPDWPDWMRRSHASRLFGKLPSSFEISRVALSPSW